VPNKGYKYISSSGNGDKSRSDDGYSYPLRDAPANTPEETKRVERLIDRVLEEHRETIKKLADE
jgi:hypothetical protein